MLIALKPLRRPICEKKPTFLNNYYCIKWICTVPPYVSFKELFIWSNQLHIRVIDAADLLVKWLLALWLHRFLRRNSIVPIQTLFIISMPINIHEDLFHKGDFCFILQQIYSFLHATLKFFSKILVSLKHDTITNR